MPLSYSITTPGPHLETLRISKVYREHAECKRILENVFACQRPFTFFGGIDWPNTSEGTAIVVQYARFSVLEFKITIRPPCTTLANQQFTKVSWV